MAQQMSRLEFLRALHDAVNKYKKTVHDGLAPEKRANSAMEAAGLQSTDWEAAHAVRSAIFEGGKVRTSPESALYEMVRVEEAFVAWSKAAKKAKKPAPSKRPARMAGKKR